MKALLTGASGWVGAALCSRLTDSGWQIVAPTRTPLPQHPSVQPVVLHAIDGANDWTAALKDVEVVVHLASRVHVMDEQAADPLSLYRQVNVQGTLNLARQAAANGVRRFVFMSSVKVNGESTLPGKPFTEDDAPAPTDPYGLSKWEAEKGLADVAARTGMQVVIVRPPLVYGPGVKANFRSLLRAVQRGMPLPLGAIHNQRSLIALGNLLDVVMLCMTHPRAAQHTFLVSDGHDLSTTELVRGLARAAGVAPRLIPVPRSWLMLAGRLLGRGAALQRLCGNLQVDSGKVRRLLGWVPPLNVEEGLRLTVREHQNS